MPYTFAVVNAKGNGDNKLRHSYLPLAYFLQTSACESVSRRANDVERYAGVTSIDAENRLEFCSAGVKRLSSKVPVTKIADQVQISGAQIFRCTGCTAADSSVCRNTKNTIFTDVRPQAFMSGRTYVCYGRAIFYFSIKTATYVPLYTVQQHLRLCVTFLYH